jgi:hypothetical protein
MDPQQRSHVRIPPFTDSLPPHPKSQVGKHSDYGEYHTNAEIAAQKSIYDGTVDKLAIWIRAASYQQL